MTTQSAIVGGRAIGRLTRTSYTYILWATAAGIVAIVRNLPAAFAGQASGLPVWLDFLFGMGTALSPTVWWIVLQLVLTRWAARAGRLRSVGVLGLIVFGFAECIGALGEPVTLAVFRPATFDPLLAVVQSGMIVLPALMAWWGLAARRGE